MYIKTYPLVVNLDGSGAGSIRVGVMTGLLLALGVIYTATSGSTVTTLVTNTATGDKTLYQVTGNTDIPVTEFAESALEVPGAGVASTPTDAPNLSLPVVQTALTATVTGGTALGKVVLVAVVEIG